MSIKKDAEELCLKVDDPWSDAMIQEAIDAKLNEDAEKPKSLHRRRLYRRSQRKRSKLSGIFPGYALKCMAASFSLGASTPRPLPT